MRKRSNLSLNPSSLLRCPLYRSTIQIAIDMPSTTERCEHVSEVRQVTPRASGCEECLALGVQWNELRVCLTCGHVGCCEDSEHAHALQHFNTTGHPVIASFERGETWSWCYVHRRYFDLEPALLPKRRSVLAAAFARLFDR
jgi:Zn-finger in ubiquitin-hydrolases and other protein